MYLEKTIENVYGDNANALIISSADFKAIGGGLHQATGNLALYKDIASVGVKRSSDNFTFSYELTGAEIDGKTTEILYNKIIESVLVDGEETNTLSGLVGQVGFQDAVIC